MNLDNVLEVRNKIIKLSKDFDQSEMLMSIDLFQDHLQGVTTLGKLSLLENHKIYNNLIWSGLDDQENGILYGLIFERFVIG